MKDKCKINDLSVCSKNVSLVIFYTEYFSVTVFKSLRKHPVCIFFSSTEIHLQTNIYFIASKELKKIFF